MEAGLTQAEAAGLIWCSEITWRQWEKDRATAGARRMHPCFWWSFQQRVNDQHKT
jgi:DNA-binding XRE family transcriptional regulator